jgi:peptide/nickel transport system permease protein
LILLMALVSWPSVAVAVRKEILTTKKMAYYEAALSLGLGPVRLFVRHVLPNVVDRLVPLAVGMCTAFLGIFGALDFIGSGVRSRNQLGALIYDSLAYLDSAPWFFWSSTLAFALLLVGLGVIASTLRRMLGGELSER